MKVISTKWIGPKEQTCWELQSQFNCHEDNGNQSESLGILGESFLIVARVVCEQSLLLWKEVLQDGKHQLSVLGWPTLIVKLWSDSFVWQKQWLLLRMKFVPSHWMMMLVKNLWMNCPTLLQKSWKVRKSEQCTVCLTLTAHMISVANTQNHSRVDEQPSCGLGS